LKADKTSFEEYTTTSGINTILDDYADRTEVVSAIQFELGDYTTSADIDARFNEFSTDDGGADLSDGHVLADQELLVKSFYEYGEENGDEEYDNQLRLFENGKYSATEIIEKLGQYVTDYMMEMFDKHSWPLITEEHAFNIDRFYIKFLMDRDADLNFTFDFSNSTYIKDLFQLNTTIQSTRISADEYQSYTYFDIDLSGNTYTKLDDRIRRNVINIRTRLDDVESALPDLDQPVLMDLKTFWDWRMGASGRNWGLGNYFPYKILGNYNGIGDSPGPSATRVLGEDGVLYGNGGTGNEGQFGGAGGSGWYGGGSSG
jgi:hypothetical protein